MALLAFLQMLDSNMAVGRRPKEGQRPQGSSGEAIKILKGQKQWVSHHTVFIRCQLCFITACKMVNIVEAMRSSRVTLEALKPTLTIQL